MFKLRKKVILPDFVATAAARPPVAATPLEDAATWLAAWSEKLGILDSESEAEFVEWADFFSGIWDSEERKLELTFVDPRLPALVFYLPPDYDEKLISMIRERIDRSVVFQKFVDLPSGGIARGQVRRNADETLFTQIITDTTPAAADIDALSRLEISLREAAGLDTAQE